MNGILMQLTRVLNASSVADTLLGASGLAVDETDKNPCICGAHTLVGKTNYEED